MDCLLAWFQWFLKNEPDLPVILAATDEAGIIIFLNINQDIMRMVSHLQGSFKWLAIS
ncbi:MAG: hypothetical protein HKN85_04030 [Gammaproteobacteria bacterium]|nr:hypothetical protein [Gammaproteobacteria bacterium]